MPVSSLSLYHLCNPERIRPLRTRTNKYKNSYIPASIIAWNDLPVNLTDSHSVQTFKAKLKSYLFNPTTPVYYSYGERLTSIFHTRLRLGHSSLSFDLFQHGLNTSKRCECGHNQEDTIHCFFHCVRYAAPRLELLASISTITRQNYRNTANSNKLLLDILLFGSSQLTLNKNLAIFKAVQLFFSKSRRFSSIIRL